MIKQTQTKQTVKSEEQGVKNCSLLTANYLLLVGKEGLFSSRPVRKMSLSYLLGKCEGEASRIHRGFSFLLHNPNISVANYLFSNGSSTGSPKLAYAVQILAKTKNMPLMTTDKKKIKNER